jgi:hypothetical protein
MSCEGCQEKNIIIVLEVSDGSKSIQIFDDNGNPQCYDYSDSKLNELQTQNPTYETCSHFLDLSI